MGVVYLVHNVLMGRDEVIKVMGRHIMEKPGVLERFLREIRAVAKLRHPNIVTAYYAVRIGESLVFAMEFIDGPDLSRVVKSNGPLAVPLASNFTYQAALGLQHAHEEGLVHRDIKPANLILSRKGNKPTVKVLDFGLSKATREQKVDSALTLDGQTLGTPDFIAPEQIIDATSADIRADIYSLGGTLFYLLSGRPPFQEKTLYDIYQAHISRDADPLNMIRPEVPAELAALVAKMMAKDPSRRFQTPAEVAEALTPFFKKASASLQTIKCAFPSTPPAPAPIQPEPPAVKKPVEPAVAEPQWESLIEFREPELGRLTSPAPMLAVAPPTQRPPWMWPAVGAGLLMLGLLGAWLSGAWLSDVRVKTSEGMIVLNDLPKDADVFVDGEKIALTWPGSGKAVEIRAVPGKRTLEVKKDGFSTFAKELMIQAGGSEPVVVRLEPSDKTRPEGSTMGSDSVASSPNDHSAVSGVEDQTVRIGDSGSTGRSIPLTNEKNYVSLFNGKDLTGWTVDSGFHSAWRVEDGELVVTGQGSWENLGFLLSDREFSDFRLRFEFQASSDANSGVAFRCLPDEFVGKLPNPLQIELLDKDRPKARNGAFICFTDTRSNGMLPPDRPFELKQGDSWNAIELEVTGDLLRVTLNGIETLAKDMALLKDRSGANPALRRRAGRIGFQSNQGTFRFRKIEIIDLAQSMLPSVTTGDETTAWRDATVFEGNRYKVFREEVHCWHEAGQMLEDGRAPCCCPKRQRKPVYRRSRRNLGGEFSMVGGDRRIEGGPLGVGR